MEPAAQRLQCRQVRSDDFGTRGDGRRIIAHAGNTSMVVGRVSARLRMEGGSMSDVHADSLIQHVSDLPGYSPAAHSGTVNRRLVGREFGAGFEMILGRVAPGGEASWHYHVDEAQIVFILKGEADVALGDEPPRRCGPGTVIRIPKGLAHEA